MDEKQRIVRQIFNTFLFRFIAMFVGIFRFLIVLNNFDPTEAGVYDQVLNIVTLGLYMLGLNVNAYLNRFVPGVEEKKQKSIFKTVIILEAGLASLFLFGFVLTNLDEYFCRYTNISRYLYVLRIGFVIIVLQILAMDFGRYFSAIKEIEFANILNFFNSTFWLMILLTIWALGFPISLELFFGIWVFGQIVSILTGAKKFRFTSFFKAKFEKSIVKSSIVFSSPLILESMGYYFINLFSRYILSHYHTAAATGLYYAAYRVPSMILELVIGMGESVFQPYIVEAHNKNEHDRKVYLMSIMIKYTYIAAIPLVTAILIGRQDIIDFVAKPGYEEAVKVIPYVAAIPIISIFIYPAHYTLYLQNRTVFLGVSYFLIAAVNVAMNFLLIPKYSYYGAALVSVGSLLTVLIVFWSFSYKETILRWNFIKFVRISVLGILSGIAVYFLYPYYTIVGNLLLRLMLMGITILVLYIPALFAVSTFAGRETEFLKDFINKQMRRIRRNKK